jgi:hypothetical protein
MWKSLDKALNPTLEEYYKSKPYLYPLGKLEDDEEETDFTQPEEWEKENERS